MAESSTASLPYVAVARGHLIQAQVHAADGNAGLIAASILQRLPRGAAHSFAYDDGHTARRFSINETDRFRVCDALWEMLDSPHMGTSY